MHRQLIIALAAALVLPVGIARAASSSAFEVGAADADITPPALDTPTGQALDAALFVPVCGSTESQIEQLWPGKRLFAFEDPYVDATGAGEYVPGDPYCDADHADRYQAPYIAGGSGVNHWPLTSADTSTNSSATTLKNPNVTPDPIGAHAVVFMAGGRRAAMVTVDSIGMFNVTMDRIRQAVSAADPDLAPANIFISSTHDESAPDPIGLWGPDLSSYPGPIAQAGSQLPAGVSSGVDEYYMNYLVQKVAQAIVTADHKVQPASMRVSVARMPANTQSCWSSYPFVDTNLMPVMQAVSTTGHVIFTLVNVGTHDESLAFSGNPVYTSMFTGDWTGRLSAWLEADYPGSVGMEMAGLVGSVETPALYPSGTQVPQVPGAFHSVPGNPVDGCSSVYPQPAGAAPQTDALTFVDEYGQSVADTAIAALSSSNVATARPTSLEGQTRSVCVQLENNFFSAAFAAGLFPDRPAYADPGCTVGASFSGSVGTGPAHQPASTRAAAPAYLATDVGVLTVGSIQIAYSPGEIFPFTEVGGPVDPSQMPFPTDCYEPAGGGNFNCGSPLPMTPDIGADMTGSFKFLAGLGQDMIGYLFPPGNFVGSQGETTETPWATYEETSTSGNDRFGYGHADDSESVGPYAGLAVTTALAGLLSSDGHGDTVLPGKFVDSQGRLCDSPFPSAGSWVTGCGSFTGAVGVRVVEPNGSVANIDVGKDGSWATYLGTRDTGTPGTSFAYSTATRGVVVDGRSLLIDVYSYPN